MNYSNTYMMCFPISQVNMFTCSFEMIFHYTFLQDTEPF